jgi:hypothetical protein
MTIAYTVTVSNEGTTAVNSPSFSDTLPGNLAFAGVVAPEDWECITSGEGTGVAVTCSHSGAFAPGASTVFTIRATIPAGQGAGTTYTNTANGSPADGNGNDSDSVTTTVGAAPTANDDTFSVGEDSGGDSLDVLANDTGAAGTKQVVEITDQADHGTAERPIGGGSVIYTPNPNFCGSDSFTYRINGDPTDPSTATVAVTVTCVDDPPVAVDDGVTVSEDSGATAIDVLANDTDVDGGPKSLASVTQPAHGTASNSAAYTPNANFCGTDTFTYTLNGGDSGTVFVTVSCVDDAPVAVNDSVTVAQDSGPTPINLLGNDTDIDGGPKAITAGTQPAHGTAFADGSYKPAPGYCGPDSFTYTLNGGSQATVSITVTCAPPQPGAVGVKLTSQSPFVTKGKTKVRVSCSGALGQTCTGTVRIHPAKGADGGAVSFEVGGGGLTKVLKLPVPSAVRKAVKKKGSARVTAVASFDQVDGSTGSATRKITLLP